MIGWLAATSIVVSLLMAGYVFYLAYRNRAPGRRTWTGLAIVEAVLVVELVAAVVLLARGDRPDGGLPTFVGYLATLPLVLPAGALWSHSERTRSGTIVLAVAVLVVPVLVVRLQQVWSGG